MHLSIAFLVLGLVSTVYATPVNEKAPKQDTPSKILDWMVSKSLRSPPFSRLPSTEPASSTGPIHYQFFPIESIKKFPKLLPVFNEPQFQSEVKSKAQIWIREILSVYNRELVEQPEAAFAENLDHCHIQIDSQVVIREHVTCPCQVIVHPASKPGSKGVVLLIPYINGEKHRVHSKAVVVNDTSAYI
ncbi:hypothetical protein F5879DRAFT_922254 [Lentinula edodes]|uniref:uncharacterized protein n=1 Tax=Lentinula edodes TaxID=5353 RepID=UPI001E8E66F6|nr:uncharacterized protein C8R40DRAFT_1210812 [Lentinula edodes]KAH7870930.1 hypothetical protein C8R40DRAFT_1210812 [Lentinula edodes]KAJ3904463.1 hypothetical protein F5879DRAFT_922254 [Lentinula edodes]